MSGGKPSLCEGWRPDVTRSLTPMAIPTPDWKVIETPSLKLLVGPGFWSRNQA
jgi:hypothetical protein